MNLNSNTKDAVIRFIAGDLTTSQLVNSLDDFGEFRDRPPASKRVMAGLIDSGFGDLLRSIHARREPNWKNSVRKCVANYSTASGYKDDLINEVALLLITAVGITDIEKSSPPSVGTGPAPKNASRGQNKGKNGRKRFIISVAVIATIVLIICIVQGILYYYSADACKQFDYTMAQATAQIDKGNYDAALDLFIKAGEEYKAYYMPGWHRQQAKNGARKATRLIINDWEGKVRTLLNSRKEVKAKLLTQDLPENLVFDQHTEARFNSISQKIDTAFYDRASLMVNDLLKEIYQGKGRLSDSTKCELDEAVKALPDDYWLNFIKKKVE